jgi:hypothetical protein
MIIGANLIKFGKIDKRVIGIMGCWADGWFLLAAG